MVLKNKKIIQTIFLLSICYYINGFKLSEVRELPRLVFKIFIFNYDLDVKVLSHTILYGDFVDINTIRLDMDHFKFKENITNVIIALSYSSEFELTGNFVIGTSKNNKTEISFSENISSINVNITNNNNFLCRSDIIIPSVISKRGLYDNLPKIFPKSNSFNISIPNNNLYDDLQINMVCGLVA